MMEIELEPRVKPLTFKVKGQSRESTTQKATNVLDSDLRSHWSTATNTKEWILLELDEPCLLSHIRIYNKSVLEWEIAVGLRYKPEAFVKVRPRCEAPRREMIYPTNYTPCRYVRISCLRGNPIAVFFIQLIGVSVIGLEPEFQPVVTHLLPPIISHKQDIHDMHLQLLQDITSRLLGFLPQLEADLTGLPDAADSSIRFLAMLAGPFYPILHVVNERETARLSGNISDSEASKSSVLSSALTVSSNFEPRRSHSTSSYTVFRPDAAIALLRKAYKDANLKIVCKLASRVLWKLIEPSSEDKSSKSKVSSALLVDYSNLFGDEFEIPDDGWESSYLNVLDIRAVEEGILHILYGCASQPQLCNKLAGSSSNLWSALPLVQALLPVLRPSVTSPSRFDNNFSEWNQPVLLQALSQIVGMSSSSVYRPLLHACAGYLASFSLSHAKAACVLIDLCSGVLAPWMMQAIAKIDLVMELLEDLLGTIQCPLHTLARARAALNYIMLALSGHMDDILAKYKEVMHRILFLLEMLEPFLGPAIIPMNSTSAFGDVSLTSEKQEHACIIALKIIRTAVQKSAVLLSLESEWRRGSVAPSVLLSILEPHMQLPPNIDYCKSPVSTIPDQKFPTVSSTSSLFRNGVLCIKSTGQDEYDGKTDLLDTSLKMDTSEDASLFFAPPELKGLTLTDIFRTPDNFSDDAHNDLDSEMNFKDTKNLYIPLQKGLVLDADFDAKYCNLQANYLQLMNYGECELKASEFRRLALDLHSENEITSEGHDAAIDALLLAAECYINPFFTMSFRAGKKIVNQIMAKQTEIQRRYKVSDLRKNLEKSADDLEILSHLERRRDQTVLQILLEAAQLDRTYQNNGTDGKDFQFYSEGHDEKIINLSPLDLQSADAITMVRQNQALLFNFLIQRLKKEHHSMHETLMQSLLLLLHFSTKLFCSPEIVIDIILCSAEYLNGMLATYYHQSNEGKLQLYQEKVHEVQRRWMLLQNLVIASSGGDEGTYLNDINNGVRCGNLVPSSAWLQKIPTFSTSTFPLVRIIGWMAVSRIAKQYLREPIFLVSDLPQLTNILSIYADELAVVNNIVNKKDTEVKVGQSGDGTYESQLYCVIYPDLSKFFPDMRKQFEAFGENILEAVGLQLRSLSSSVVPDLLCWFSDLCSLPFFLKDQLSVPNSSDHLKGYSAKNAKAIILYILEAIVVEHMEAIVPEIPRVVQILVSLCRVSYCDVSFLDSLLRLLKPIISYSLSKIPDEEKLLIDDSCLNFESLCFDQLFNNIKHKNDCLDGKGFSRALTIFILASIFPDLSHHRRSDFLQSIIMWADFSAFEPTTSFHDYLSAFQCVMENCKTLLLQTLKFYGAIPFSMLQSADVRTDGVSSDNSELRTWILNDLCNSSSSTEACKRLVNSGSDLETLNEEVYHICAEEIKKFCGDLEELIYKLNQSMELCWKFHHQLAKRLILTSSQLLIYSGCLLSIAKNDYKAVEDDSKTISLVSTIHWRAGLSGVAEISARLQKNHFWEAASVWLDSLLGVPKSFSLDNVLDCICSVIKIFCCNAPKIAWRVQTDKWLSTLLARGGRTFCESDAPLIGLFLLMLGHPEPEQRFIALRHLEILFSQKVNGGLVYTFHNMLVSADLVPSISELNLCNVVLGTWDQVIALASTDSSLLLRTHAMFVLMGYMPYADLHKVQSFLASADSVLPCLGKSIHPNCEGVTLQLSLALIASACLYSPFEDIKLIPQNIWRSIENIAMSKAGKLGDLEKTACQALCRLRNEGDEAKEALKEVLLSNTPKRLNPDFHSTRESILQVIADLTSVRSYFEIFSEKIDREAMELEEAEIELDVVQKDGVLQDSSKDHKEVNRFSCPAAYMTNGSRLQQIKDSIRSMEKSKIREDIVYIQQKKAFARHARRKSLEEGALREAELIQELDRERRDEAERDLERQRLLELERAKTRELRHNLDMEKERETQREIQREIEQAESGGRPSRREYPSTTHNRPRERNRERENVRFSKEGINRASSGNYQPENPSISSSMPTVPVVRSGSQPFSGHMPTIFQSRDRSDDCGSNYDENLDGSKDSGDTGSFGDPESVSALDGQSGGGYGSGQRHGSRGTSRQIFDRRERDGRREGKWERKH